jgi:hypothetical protein
MKTYCVKVRRTIVEVSTFYLDTDTQEEAKEMAKDKNHFDEDGAEIEVENFELLEIHEDPDEDDE